MSGETRCLTFSLAVDLSRGKNSECQKPYFPISKRGLIYYFLRETGVRLWFYLLPLFWTGGLKRQPCSECEVRMVVPPRLGSGRSLLKKCKDDTLRSPEGICERNSFTPPGSLMTAYCEDRHPRIWGITADPRG